MKTAAIFDTGDLASGWRRSRAQFQAEVVSCTLDALVASPRPPASRVRPPTPTSGAALLLHLAADQPTTEEAERCLGF